MRGTADIGYGVGARRMKSRAAPSAGSRECLCAKGPKREIFPDAAWYRQLSTRAPAVLQAQSLAIESADCLAVESLRGRVYSCPASPTTGIFYCRPQALDSNRNRLPSRVKTPKGGPAL